MPSKQFRVCLIHDALFSSFQRRLSSFSSFAVPLLSWRLMEWCCVLGFVPTGSVSSSSAVYLRSTSPSAVYHTAILATITHAPKAPDKKNDRKTKKKKEKREETKGDNCNQTAEQNDRQHPLACRQKETPKCLHCSTRQLVFDGNKI